MPRPALDRAHPSGAVPGSYRPARHRAVSVLMDDGSWHQLDALGWVRDASGEWRVLLRYYDDQPEQSQREDWYLFNPERVRPV